MSHSRTLNKQELIEAIDEVERVAKHALSCIEDVSKDYDSGIVVDGRRFDTAYDAFLLMVSNMRRSLDGI